MTEIRDRTLRILIAEDEIEMTRLLERMLERAGLTTFSATTGKQAIELATVHDYDLIVLDLRLPDMHGSDVLSVLRSKGIATPVLVLTGDASADHKLRCFGLGADDYLSKPFHSDELIARIRAIVRRAQDHQDPVVRIGRLTINLTEKTALVRGRPLNLTPREYEVLEVLALHKGLLMTKGAIVSHLYGGMDEPEHKVIDVYVSNTRKKLKSALGAGTYIATVWGRGYTLHDPDSTTE